MISLKITHGVDGPISLTLKLTFVDIKGKLIQTAPVNLYQRHPVATLLCSLPCTLLTLSSLSVTAL